MMLQMPRMADYGDMQPPAKPKIDKWDQRFIDLARLVSGWSKDPRKKVGAVITNPNRSVASLGYNGFARGMSDWKGFYADKQVKLARIIHAEVNAILNATSTLDGCTLYVWPFMVCERCAVQVIQVGITRVVSPVSWVSSSWAQEHRLAEAYFREAGVEVTVLDNNIPHHLTY